MTSTNRYIRSVSRLGCVPLLAVGLVVGGCSSSGSKAKFVASTTKSQFVARIDSICQRSNDQLGNAAGQAFGNQQPALDSWRRFMVETAMPIIERRLDAMKAVAAPASDASSVKTILAAGVDAVARAKTDPSLMSPGSRAPFEHYDDLVTAYGIGTCGVGS